MEVIDPRPTMKCRFCDFRGNEFSMRHHLKEVHPAKNVLYWKGYSADLRKLKEIIHQEDREQRLLRRKADLVVEEEEA